MKTEEQIRKELKKHIAHRRLIMNDPQKERDKDIDNWIISTLEWVIGGKIND